jgi:hypothetical protein
VIPVMELDNSTAETLITTFTVQPGAAADDSVFFILTWHGRTQATTDTAVFGIKHSATAAGEYKKAAGTLDTLGYSPCNDNGDNNVLTKKWTYTELGWAAGDKVHLKFFRIPAHAKDNLASDALVEELFIMLKE